MKKRVIKVKKGCSIPLQGGPEGKVQEAPLPKEIALDVSDFSTIKFSLLKKEGDEVQTGEPLLHDKHYEKRLFVAPISGKIIRIERGHKRKLLSVVIEVASQQKMVPIKATSSSKDEIFTHMLQGGFFALIRSRPCDILANPDMMPKSIFIKAVETAPYAPPPEFELQGQEEMFQEGLAILKKIAPLYLVAKSSSFFQFQHADCYQIEGPHPAGNASIHIAEIDPIFHAKECRWVLTVHEVIALGTYFAKQEFYFRKIISVAGEGLPQEKRGYFSVNAGISVQSFLPENFEIESNRILSGDPLTGRKIDVHDFLGLEAKQFTVLPEQDETREMFHFMRLGARKFSATKAYLSGFFKRSAYPFTTNQHGEERAFLDGSIYDKVMPLPIPTMPLLKAVLAEDFEKAEEYGLLEIAPEDFAVTSFICPSKINHMEIIRSGLQTYVDQYL